MTTTHRPLDQLLADRAKAQSEADAALARVDKANAEIKALAEAAQEALK